MLLQTPGPLPLRVNDKGVLVTTPTLSALPSVDGAVDEVAPTILFLDVL